MSVIKIGMATCGRAAGGMDVYTAFEEEIKKNGLSVEIASTGCIGLCSQEVIAEIELDGKTRLTYGNILPEAVPDIFEKTVKNGEVIKENVLYQYHPESRDQQAYEGVPFIDEFSVSKGQIKIALKNCGNIDPFSIEVTFGRSIRSMASSHAARYSGISSSMPQYESHRMSPVGERICVGILTLFT